MQTPLILTFDVGSQSTRCLLVRPDGGFEDLCQVKHSPAYHSAQPGWAEQRGVLPNTVVTTHMSHCYAQGANLYFIFITKMNDADEFKRYHTTILDAIQRSGAAISHHHGIGKMFAPWLEGYLGEKEYGAVKVLKHYFDPDGVMNPGGTLGLDLAPEEKKFLNNRRDYR